MPVHPIDPVYDASSKILILGSFPSVLSRETGFFYGHPRNRFWRLLGALFEEETPVSIPDRKSLLLRHHIALWDVIGSCEIHGSSDLSIRSVVPNDILPLLKKTGIRKIFVNGKTAKKYYDRYLRERTGIEAHVLPSSSPANAAWSFERLLEEWKVIRESI